MRPGTRLWNKWFRPDASYPSIETVDWTRVRQLGYRLILLDVDNTLMPHGRRGADESARARVQLILQADIGCVILSNARLERAEAVGRDLGLPAYGLSGKPSGRGCREAAAAEGVPMDQVLLVGDQFFTDLWAGHNAGCRTLLVTPLTSIEPWYIRLKRAGERLLKRLYMPEPYYDELPPARTA